MCFCIICALYASTCSGSLSVPFFARTRISAATSADKRADANATVEWRETGDPVSDVRLRRVVGPSVVDAFLQRPVALTPTGKREKRKHSPRWTRQTSTCTQLARQSVQDRTYIYIYIYIYAYTCIYIYIYIYVYIRNRGSHKQLYFSDFFHTCGPAKGSRHLVPLVHNRLQGPVVDAWLSLRAQPELLSEQTTIIC